MQQQVANFLARRWSVPPGALAVDVRPTAGGLESRVARASVLPGRHHGREPRRWFASASNGLSGAICYHLAVLTDPNSTAKMSADSRHALMDWERVIRRAATLLTTSSAR